jgi:hypothetical protein
MKHMMKFALLLALATGLVSCDLFNVDVETTLSGELDIAVDDPMIKSAEEGIPFDSWRTLYPGDDEEIAKYKDQIVAVEVDGIIAEVEWVSEADVYFLSGSLFVIYDDEDTVSWSMDTDWEVYDGATFMMDDLGGEKYDSIAVILEDVDPFTIGMVGASSKTGIEATVRIDIKTVITGSLF